MCVDCKWKDSCQTLKKIDEIRDRRQNSGHTNDTFEVVIYQCSIKNYDRSYKTDKDDKSLYYCTECNSMHHSSSRIGKLHKKIA